MKTRKTPTLGITMPQSLIDELDRRAASVRLSRSRLIATLLFERLDEKSVSTAVLLERIKRIEAQLAKIMKILKS